MSLSSNFPTSKPSLNLDFANTKRLDPRVTFTRSTTGTYYDGVTTAMAEQNLLLYSQELDNAAYTKSTVTVTANSSTAPDGTSTADLVFPSSTGVDRAIGISTIATQVGLPYTISVYAKASGLNFIYFLTYGGSTSPTTQLAFFNLSTGAVGQTGSYFTSASIVSVGNGWYRCIATANATIAGSYPYIGLADANNSGTATASGSNGVLLWGFQFEQRSTVTAYTATTTQPITNYIPVLLTAAANVPRFDHNPTTDESLGLLIEEQRTNLCTYSEDIASWPSNTRVTINSNSVVAPSGALTADTIVPTSGNNTHYSQSALMTGTAGNYYTGSVYAKPAGWTRFALEVFIGGNDGAVWFDLSAGTIFASTAGYSGTITAVGNGWYKLTVTSPVAVSNTNGTLVLHPLPASVTTDTTIATGDGFSGVTVWGAQMEAAAFATSYIATTSLAVTRTADAASMTGTNFTSWFNAGEGTFYGEANLSGGSRYFHTGKTGSSAQIEGVQQTTYFEAFVYTTDVQAQINIAAASFINRRVALAYQVNDIAACVSGGAVSVDTNAILPLDLNAFYVNSYGTSGPLGSGTVKKVAYYPARLTNAQLQAITS